MRVLLRKSSSARSRRARRGLGAAVAAVALLGAVPAVASAAPPAPGQPAPPSLVPLLSGFSKFWRTDGRNDLHGTVLAPGTLAYNDMLAVWINNHATRAQQFRALQDSEYNNATSTAYDESLTISTALGSVLGRLYVTGTERGRLPLTQALINSSDGTAGAYVSTSTAKAYYSYPRPYLPTDPGTPPVPGDAAGCAPSLENGSSLTSIRAGQPYADANGNLKIVRVPGVTDTTHEFSPHNVALSPGYGTTGICTAGSFPSGHTTTAYEAGVTLATLLPELAPEILARASEQGNDRIVLGVHYPIDIMGGRIDGEAALAALWSDRQFRAKVLEPARAELVKYLQRRCGGTLPQCVAREKAYYDNPYGGQAMPGGTAQIVSSRRSALQVYTQRLTYGFAPAGRTRLAPAVPAGAGNLLLTSFPTLTAAQRTSILAQTEIGSGYPLDGTGTSRGSWERLNLAAAMSATVRVGRQGSVTVLRVGGQPTVVRTRPHH
jgi:membrane-associated phospholipid phosphatase